MTELVMTVFDYAALAIIGFSVLIGVMRGVVREAIALMAWGFAFLGAKLFASNLVPYLPASIPSESLRYFAAFTIVFLLVLLAVSLLSIVVSQLVKFSGLGLIDRIFGMLFGFLRGIFICTVFVLLAGFTAIPRDARWQNAVLSAPFEALVAMILPWLPEDIAKHVKYEEALL